MVCSWRPILAVAPPRRLLSYTRRPAMERIHVAVRAWPLSVEDARSSPWRIAGNAIALSVQPSTCFEFDWFFGEECHTADVYDARTKHIVDSAVRGFNENSLSACLLWKFTMRKLMIFLSQNIESCRFMRVLSKIAAHRHIGETNMNVRIGYPIGGDTISVTSGVVSRIEILSYVHGSTELLGLQNQQLLDQLFELKLKEQQLQDVNKDLRRKIQETSGENVLHMSCQDVGPSRSSGHANEANQELLHPAVCDPSLPCIYGKELITSAIVVSLRSFY